MARKLFVSHLGRAIGFHEKVAENMLTAAAQVVKNQAKRNVRGGFKSGDFLTSNLFNKIEFEVDLSAKVARVGTTVDYGLYWEVGHNNVYTRQYEREEWLRPALEKTEREQRDAAVKAAKRTRSFI